MMQAPKPSSKPLHSLWLLPTPPPDVCGCLSVLKRKSVGNEVSQCYRKPISRILLAFLLEKCWGAGKKERQRRGYF